MVPADERAALHDPAVVLPFANLRTATGERKATGLANSLQAADPVRKMPPTRIVELEPGAAEGASGIPPSRAAGGTVRRAPRVAPGAASTAESSTPRATLPNRAVAATQPAARRISAARAAEAGRAARAAAAEPTWISSEGLARLRAEHEELTTRRRPEVIARIKAAKELGDLKENADYAAAREEQSFLEGRIAAIEGTLRGATVIEAADTSVEGVVSLGATVTIEDELGGHSTFRIVGSAEADPAAGRISNVSPVGRALLGHAAGETVEIAAPRGAVHYRIVDVSS
jgi:transcription elongation factor GreA